MNKITLIGLILTILSVVMMFFVATMFSNSHITNPLIAYTAQYSLWLWLPTLIIGIAFLTWPIKRKKV